MSKRKILLINRGNSDNFGDQAINFAMTKLLEEIDFDVYFSDLIRQKKTSFDYRIKSKEKQYTKRVSNFILIAIKRLRWVIKNFHQLRRTLKGDYDYVVIGGGQLINSNLTFPVAVFLWTILTKYLTKANLVFFAIGVDSKFSFFERVLYKLSLNRADRIIVRDLKSKENLLKIFNLSADVTPDVVFSINRFIELKPQNKTKKVIINPTQKKRFAKHASLEFDFSQEFYWTDLVKKYVETGYEVEFFYTTRDDYTECYKYQQLVKKESNLVIGIANITSIFELAELVSSAEIVVSQRMHALIFGYVYNSNLVPILISDKLKAFKKEYVDNRVDLLELQRRTMNFFSDTFKE